jgi:hypothetical protein
VTAIAARSRADRLVARYHDGVAVVMMMMMMVVVMVRFLLNDDRLVIHPDQSCIIVLEGGDGIGNRGEQVSIVCGRCE